LVLSRPCVARRASEIVVAAIEKYKNKVKLPSTFEEHKQVYTEIRDGLTTPDQFYLGQIEGQNEPFCARFNRLFTIAVPKEPQKRMDFVQRRRIARLEDSFLHDLHQRMFRAFASLGFDDYDWFPDSDLYAIVASADKELAKKRLTLAEINSEKAHAETGHSGDANLQQKLKGLTDKAQALIDEIESLTQESQPYRDALKARGNSP